MKILETLHGIVRDYDARNKFYAVFNVNSEQYRFVNTDHILLVTEYGKNTGNFDESIKLANLHNKIKDEFARCGTYLDDDRVKELISSAIHFN